MTRPDYCPVAQEPCQAMCALSNVRCKIRDTDRTAPRQWVGLTDEEIYQIGLDTPIGATNFARAIEAKLKEKNT